MRCTSWDGTGRNEMGMGRNEMRWEWDGMRWDGMGQIEMGWDGISLSAFFHLLSIHFLTAISNNDYSFLILDSSNVIRHLLICMYVRTDYICGVSSCGCDGRKDGCHQPHSRYA